MNRATNRGRAPVNSAHATATGLALGVPETAALVRTSSSMMLPSRDATTCARHSGHLPLGPAGARAPCAQPSEFGGRQGSAAPAQAAPPSALAPAALPPTQPGLPRAAGALHWRRPSGIRASTPLPRKCVVASSGCWEWSPRRRDLSPSALAPWPRPARPAPCTSLGRPGTCAGSCGGGQTTSRPPEQ